MTAVLGGILESDMEDKETIYDEQIAPLMTQLLEVCQREGIPMFSSFQYSGAGFCTSAQSTGHCVFDHYRALAQCAEHGGVNVDKYMNWVAKDARKNGHSSIYLKMSGVPEVPPNALGQEPCAGVCARSPAPECYTPGTTEQE